MNWQDNIYKRNQLQRGAILKSFDDELIKAKELPIGSISTHGGVKVQKTGKDKWTPVSELKGKPSMPGEKLDQAQQIIDGSGSKSSKARDLSDLGMKTSSIAKHLDMHYSHAYSVVSKHKKSKEPQEGTEKVKEMKTGKEVERSTKELDQRDEILTSGKSKSKQAQELSNLGYDNKKIANLLGVDVGGVEQALQEQPSDKDKQFEDAKEQQRLEQSPDSQKLKEVQQMMRDEKEKRATTYKEEADAFANDLESSQILKDYDVKVEVRPVSGSKPGEIGFRDSIIVGVGSANVMYVIPKGSGKYELYSDSSYDQGRELKSGDASDMIKAIKRRRNKFTTKQERENQPTQAQTLSKQSQKETVKQAKQFYNKLTAAGYNDNHPSFKQLDEAINSFEKTSNHLIETIGKDTPLTFDAEFDIDNNQSFFTVSTHRGRLLEKHMDEYRQHKKDYPYSANIKDFTAQKFGKMLNSVMSSKFSNRGYNYTNTLIGHEIARGGKNPRSYSLKH